MFRSVQQLSRHALLLAGVLAMQVASAGRSVEVQVTGIQGDELSNVRAFLSIDQLEPETSLVDRLTSLQQERDRKPISERMLRRLHKQAAQEIGQALQAYGYYQPLIESSLKQTEAGWLATYHIEPGPPVLLQSIDVRIDGEGNSEPAFQDLLKKNAMHRGDRLLHGKYEALKTALTRVAFRQGYLDAEFTASKILIDRAARTADVHLVLNTGARYYFGPITIAQDILDRQFVERFTRIRQGQPFRTDQLLALQSALTSSGYFSRVEVEAKRDQAVDYRIPVLIHTEPRKRRTYALGAGYATDTGPRVTVGVLFRRVNRRGHQVMLDSRVSSVKSEASAQYQIPIANVTKDRLVFRAGASREDINRGEATNYTLGASYNRGWLGAQWRLYADLSHENYSLAGEDDDVIFLTPGVNLSRLKSDDLLFPRNGHSWALDIRGANEQVVSDTSYLRAEANGNIILPLGSRGRLLLRGQIGGIGADNIEGVPATERFYAGGDQSVRGYGYQKLGPTEDGQNTGGRYLLVGSVEADYLLHGNYGAAVFFDAGNADEDFLPDLKRSAGIGFRWRSPVGMARLDLAKALDEDRDFRVHISIGAKL